MNRIFFFEEGIEIHNSLICGIDAALISLRMRDDAFRLQNDIKEGIQTALALSPDQSWCVRGTSSGYLGRTTRSMLLQPFFSSILRYSDDQLTASVITYNYAKRVFLPVA